MKIRKLLGVIILIALIILVLFYYVESAKPRYGSLTLLTVVDPDNASVGGTADVSLELKPGLGRIYISTSAFTRLDTQISTHFAKEVACRFVEADCTQYDFFYTFDAQSNIVGGPSASAAISALTASLLENTPIDESYGITGTIQSGGAVGPVGGIREKIDAAEKKGLSGVIISKWTQPARNTTFVNSSSLQIPLLLQSLDQNPSSISIEKVGALDEILTVLTKKNYTRNVSSLQIPKEYITLMNETAQQMCNRSSMLMLEVQKLNNTNNSLYNQAIIFLEDAKIARGKSLFYSEASYCFSSNLRLRRLQLETFDQNKIDKIANDLKASIQTAKAEIFTAKLSTINDLQTKAIVAERFVEAQNSLETDNHTSTSLSYALERYHSGIVWSKFFALPSPAVSLDENHLEEACQAKLTEVEERISYVSIVAGDYLTIDRAQLNEAYDRYYEDEFALCLFKASKAKAEIDVILSSFSISSEEYPDFIDEKLSLTKNILHKEINQNRFSLMGYSYYEYAGVLKDDDPYLASLFTDYSLELSDLSVYFPQTNAWSYGLRYLLANPFFLGFLLGSLIMALLLILFYEG